MTRTTLTTFAWREYGKRTWTDVPSLVRATYVLLMPACLPVPCVPRATGPPGAVVAPESHPGLEGG
jgi:hypothetical protein